jgi:hypothetical protein
MVRPLIILSGILNQLDTLISTKMRRTRTITKRPQRAYGNARSAPRRQTKQSRAIRGETGNTLLLSDLYDLDVVFPLDRPQLPVYTLIGASTISPILSVNGGAVQAYDCFASVRQAWLECYIKKMSITMTASRALGTVTYVTRKGNVDIRNVDLSNSFDAGLREYSFATSKACYV